MLRPGGSHPFFFDDIVSGLENGCSQTAGLPKYDGGKNQKTITCNHRNMMSGNKRKAFLGVVKCQAIFSTYQSFLAT